MTKKNKGNLIIISGPSGVGKGTICEQLLKDTDSISLSVSATTRQPRPIDVDGVTYFFKTTDEFKSMIDRGEFLEWAQYGKNYYGTPLKPVTDKLNQGIDVLLEIEVQGALQVMENYPDGIYIFIAPPDVETLHKRLTGRGTETPEEIEKRISAADNELAMQNKYTYVVINDVLEDAVQSVKDIISSRSV